MQRRVQVLHFVFLVALAVVLAACPAPAAPQAPVVQTVVVIVKETVVMEVTRVVEVREVSVGVGVTTPTRVVEEAAAAPAAVAVPVFVGDPIRIGLQVPLSGPNGAEGLTIKQGAELMAEQANAAGGIDGREVILLVEDDRGDPAMATQAAERLVGQGVTAVIGSYNAVTTDPAAYVYNRAGVVQLIPSCAPPLPLDKGFHQSFRVCFSEERTSQATSDFVTEVLDAQSIVILNDGSPDATQLAELAQQDMVSLGAQVSVNEVVSPTPLEVQALLERLKTANPEVVYYAGAAAPVATAIRQARDAGLQVIWVLSDSANVSELTGLVGPQNLSGTYIVADPLPSLLEAPATQRFLADYRTKFNVEPTLWSAMAADATLLVEEAVRANNSTDPQVLSSYLHDRLRGFSGITGRILGFDTAGDRLGTGDIVLMVTANGRVVIYLMQP